MCLVRCVGLFWVMRGCWCCFDVVLCLFVCWFVWLVGRQVILCVGLFVRVYVVSCVLVCACARVIGCVFACLWCVRVCLLFACWSVRWLVGCLLACWCISLVVV